MPTTGMDKAISHMQARAARMRDLSPVMRVVGEEIVKRTTQAFRAQQSPAGEAWPALAPSTLAQRAAKLPGAKRRSKKTGRLTPAARTRRAQAASTGAGITPLVDTGRLRNSAQQISQPYGPGANFIEWSVVGYGGPHMGGSASRRPPKRNFSVFEPGAGGWTLIPAVNDYLKAAFTNWVDTGKPGANR